MCQRQKLFRTADELAGIPPCYLLSTICVPPCFLFRARPTPPRHQRPRSLYSHTHTHVHFLIGLYYNEGLLHHGSGDGSDGLCLRASLHSRYIQQIEVRRTGSFFSYNHMMSNDGSPIYFALSPFRAVCPAAQRAAKVKSHAWCMLDALLPPGVWPHHVQAGVSPHMLLAAGPNQAGT